MESRSDATVRLAAFQAPFLPTGSTAEALRLIRERIAECEALGVEFLCCPEGILGGLADYAAGPVTFAIARGALEQALVPLASATVTTIVGFTEQGNGGTLYNAAAVLHRGKVLGVYRKLHPAINRSVYSAGSETPVFTVENVTFGIVICRDSTFAEPARRMARHGARILFVPTNCGMPASRGGASLVAAARNDDVARATENGVVVVRADVTGRYGELVSHGSAGIVDCDGHLLAEGQEFVPGLLVREIQLRH